MAKKLPSTDVVVVGLGWAGSIIANELADENLKIIGFERGPWRDTAADFNVASAADELRYNRRQDLMVRTRQNTTTIRNSVTETALPMRSWGSFHPGNGTGGAGNHWAGISFRFQPHEFRLHSHLSERYGKELSPELTLQDWGTDWDEMEPFYAKFDRLAGISGKAGNIKGVIQEGGNTFEGPRSEEYPNPPTAQTYAPTLFAEAARNLGYKPFPVPSALQSRPYVNSLGVAMGACTFCGFCTNYGCANYSKASAITTVLPVLVRKPNFTAMTNCEVLRVTMDSSGKRATGIVYMDANGEEWEQPAELVVISAFIFENVRLMLLSGVGQPYDPVTNTGTTGRNYAYQTANSVRMFFDDKNFNPFIGGGAIGMGIDEFNNDNFDHSGLGFVGGGSTRVTPIGAAPIDSRPLPPGTPAWGSEWKKATVKNYAATMSIGCEASSYATRTNYLSLDPTYKDPLGRPLLRITFDFPENDRKMAAYVTGKVGEIAKSMNPRQMVPSSQQGHWNSAPYQSSHIVGGFIMGADPKNSSVNKHLQVWGVPNLFVVGSSAFPQNPGYNPTGTVAALAFKAADAIRTRYLKRPGEMISV
ncbi:MULTISPECIES: GMC family oxidoreductase [Pseudomonas]|uniref:GMC family oxidoreductase n=1 Tax=Pseudomonas graminis TaxID=158627 RepID=A0A1C2DH85_9PSED|nr:MULTISPECIES: GMC family oxidoreductase [Pseudomonas]MBD8597560.1 GMC family oxidoreductase [Pseudomonas sp. CFBP 8772]OCX14119.1 GMC family oxidoreductase [Pseudomonas graminis]PHX42052.1 GMC family oxidoreductase [Pseudomonas sp. NZIPFR-PS5]RZI73148.1 MAG: GMC family oxidoreductase [Pseudomonas sp.]